LFEGHQYIYQGEFMKSMKSVAICLALTVSLAPVLAHAAPPPGYCEVDVCNKLERFTLSPWKAMKDSMGETCQPALLGKEDAVEGKQLSASSRWYQGSFNITKQSVTRVKRVKSCTPAEPAK
jgi:hypothetical protein